MNVQRWRVVVLACLAAASLAVGGTVAAKAPSGKKQQLDLPASSKPLALDREETALRQQHAGVRLDVTSAAFSNNAPIPTKYSAYEQDNSFPLAWGPGPNGTKSYALIMEDPDSKKPPVPVIHWIAWNIPGSQTSLREGLEKRDLLEDPEGLRQGPNATGSVGYYGPRPPPGDAPHHYHVQLFALDVELDILANSNRDELLKGMQGHVLAKGELVGTFVRP